MARHRLLIARVVHGLIADVEHYRAANGRYPASLLSVWEDYRPGIMGIEAYRYEPSGDAFNLFFEQFSDRFGTREFVPSPS